MSHILGELLECETGVTKGWRVDTRNTNAKTRVDGSADFHCMAWLSNWVTQKLFNNIGFSRLHKIQQQTPKWRLLSLREKCDGQKIEYALTRRASETIQKLSLLTPSPKFGSSYLHYFFSDIFFIALKIHETFYMYIKTLWVSASNISDR